MAVLVINGGDHQHKINAAADKDKNNISKVFQSFLSHCGFEKDLNWKLRVEKTLHCSSETKLVRAICCSKFGEVIVRVKANKNDTADHKFVVIRPDGFKKKAEELLTIFKEAEKTFGGAEKVIPKVVEEVKEEKQLPLVLSRPDFSSLKKTTDNPTRVQYIVAVTYNLSLSDNWDSYKHWLDTFSSECNFDIHNYAPKTVGIILYHIKKSGFLTDFYNSKCENVGFKPTALGLRLAKGDMKAFDERSRNYIELKRPKVIEKKPVVAPVVTAKTNYADDLVNLAEKAQLVADAGKKIQAFRIEKEVIKGQIAELQAKLHKISLEEENVVKSFTTDQKTVRKIATL